MYTLMLLAVSAVLGIIAGRCYETADRNASLPMGTRKLLASLGLLFSMSAIVIATVSIIFWAIRSF